MIDWRAKVADKTITQFDWRLLNRKQKKQLLRSLEDAVPLVPENDELVPRMVRAHPDHPKVKQYPELVWAAEVLLLGELTADVRGNPPTDLEQWHEITTSLSDLVAEIRAEPEEIKSVHAHIDSIERIQDELEYLTDLMRRQCKPETEKAWIEEVIAGAARLGFALGRHTQSVLFHPSERLAVSRKKMNKDFFERRDLRNSGRLASAEKRRKIIRNLLRQTKLRGKALDSWLVRKLKEEDIDAKESTIRRDRRLLKAEK